MDRESSQKSSQSKGQPNYFNDPQKPWLFLVSTNTFKIFLIRLRNVNWIGIWVERFLLSQKCQRQVKAFCLLAWSLLQQFSFLSLFSSKNEHLKQPKSKFSPRFFVLKSGPCSNGQTYLAWIQDEQLFWRLMNSLALEWWNAVFFSEGWPQKP